MQGRKPLPLDVSGSAADFQPEGLSGEEIKWSQQL